MKPQRKICNGIVYYKYTPKISKNEAIPLLMIHGHGGDHRGLEALAQALERTIVIPDLPGFGESQELPVSHTIENYVVSLMAFMSELKIQGYFLVGHSLGSAIALALAASDRRVQKLVLLNPIPEFTKYIRYLIKTLNGVGSKMPQKYADALVNAKLYTLATFLMHSRRRTDKSYAKQYLATQNTAQYSFNTWSQSGESIFFFDQMKLAEEISVPVLVVHSDKDSLTTLRSIEAFTHAFKNAKLQRAAKAGHFLPLEDSALTADYIDEFLNQS